MEPTDNVIDISIKQAQPVNRQGEPDPYADQRADKYAIQSGVLCLLKPAYDRDAKERIEISIPLTVNFAARLIEEILLDDGLEARAAFVVEGRTTGKRPLHAVTVPASAFNGMTWITQHWGSRAIVCAGQTTKDNLRAALQILSGDIPRRTVYGHTGWRKLDGAWAYLTGSGAIGADGLREDVHVDLGHGHIGKHRLPVPPSGQELQVAAGRLLDLLDISPARPEIGAALLACAVRAVLGEAHRNDFALFLVGPTGAQKSEAAALLQACFGAEFDARSFPAGWSDTPNDLEHKSHQAKDAIFTVDDFKPSVSPAEAAKLHATAERLFRAVGNQAGRGRRNHDMSARPAYHPRGMIVATGEDSPRGASLLGRMLIIDIRRGDIDLSNLTGLQHAARCGQLAAAMSGFIQWLAPRMDDLKRIFPKLVRDRRDQTLADGHIRSHPRAAEMFGSLAAGVEAFLDFAVDAKVLAAGEANEVLGRIEAGLMAAFQEQAGYQAEQDEVKRFMSLLRACLSSGNGHVADHLNQGPPVIRPHSWGWRDQGDDLHKPMGDCIGWLNATEGQAWLDQEAVFAAVQRLARVQGEPLLISAGTLWRRVQERGLLAATEPVPGQRPRTTVKRFVGGRTCRVMVIAAALLDAPD